MRPRDSKERKYEQGKLVGQVRRESVRLDQTIRAAGYSPAEMMGVRLRRKPATGGAGQSLPSCLAVTETTVLFSTVTTTRYIPPMEPASR